MEKREVYFDNSATTRAFDEVRDIVAGIYKSGFDGLRAKLGEQ